MIKLDQQLGDLGEQILQVHDSILVECSAQNADKVDKLLHDILENIAPELNVRLKVDVSNGYSWGDL